MHIERCGKDLLSSLQLIATLALARLIFMLNKSATSAVNFINRTIEFFKTLAIIIDSVLSDNGKEYTSRWRGCHKFEECLIKHNIKHKYIKVRSPWTNGYAERFKKDTA